MQLDGKKKYRFRHLINPLFILYAILFQGKCQAAYFVLVLHHLRSVVITVRGTETPEDLITDGLCRECILSANDLDGLIKYLSVSIPHLSLLLMLTKPHAQCPCMHIHTLAFVQVNL